MTEQGRNLIGADWVAARSGRSFESVNPAKRSETLGTFPRSGAEDIDAAVTAAQAAFPEWRRTPPHTRAEILMRAASLLAERKEELARLITADTGKVLHEAGGEVQEAIDSAEHAATYARLPFGETVPSDLPERMCLTWREPLGVMALITPAAFPMGVPSSRICSALVAGNTVVFHPSHETPLAAQRFVELLNDAGVPPGTVNLIHGDEDVDGLLASHPGIRGVHFTGANDPGRDIATACVRTSKRVSLFMTGKNAALVMDDADLDLAVRGCAWAAFGTSGQRTTAVSRIIVHRDLAAEVTKRLRERAEALRVGDGMQPGMDIGPLVSEARLRRVHSYTELAREEGATVLTGGRILTEGSLGDGFFYAPTILVNVTPTMRVIQEIIFGPTVGILEVSSLEEAIECANASAYGLALSIYTRDLSRAFRAMRELDSGMVYVNAGSQAEIQMPFGGTKATGNGTRILGSKTLDEFTELKAIYVDHSGRFQRAQIDTQSD